MAWSKTKKVTLIRIQTTLWCDVPKNETRELGREQGKGVLIMMVSSGANISQGPSNDNVIPMHYLFSAGGKTFRWKTFFRVVWRTQVECDCNSWSHVDTLCQSLLFLTFVCIAQIISQRIDCTVDQKRLEEWLFAENPKQGSFRPLLEQKLDYYGGPPKISQTLVLGSLWETVDQQEN